MEKGFGNISFGHYNDDSVDGGLMMIQSWIFLNMNFFILDSRASSMQRILFKPVAYIQDTMEKKIEDAIGKINWRKGGSFRLSEGGQL